MIFFAKFVDRVYNMRAPPAFMHSIIEKFYKYISKYLSTKLVFIMDLCLSFAATVLTWLFAVVFLKADVFRGSFTLLWLIASVVASVIAFLLSRSYKMIIRHSSFRDIFKYCVASFLKVVIMWVPIWIYGLVLDPVCSGTTISLLLLADFLMTSFFLVLVRFCMIVVYSILTSRLRESQKCKRVLLYSTSEKSVAMLTRLQKSPHYKVVGFISSDVHKRVYTIAELPIYYLSDVESFESVRKRVSFDAILFSLESDVKKERERIVDFAAKNSVRILIAPTIDEVSGGVVQHNSIREVKIEDLLGREEIKISLDAIISNFKGKTVMVTGAAGSIGSELCRQLAGFGVKRLILYDNAETPMHNLRLELSERFPDLDYVPVIGDVRLKKRLDFAFRTYRPQVVFHAAAYKHVPLMEENPCEAVLVNVAGSRNVADKCVEYDIEKMVMISTDKAVNPTNIMGCTKRLAEIYVQSLGLAIESGKVKGNTKFVTTRFGNVLGSNGSVIPRFREQIAKGGPVTVTHPDIIRFFMTIPEACLLVMEAATMPTANRICVFDMGEPVKIDTLARRMIELAGLKPDIDIKVEYTGLRPGEKLYEEVLSNVENTDPTSHDRIRIARVRGYEYDEAVVAVDKLEELSRAVEIPTMVKLMKKIVPEFISKNSKFSEYDVKQ